MDKNGNSNCLEGYECPNCGWNDQLNIWVTTKIEMFDRGSGDHEDLDYDDNSHAECPNCGHGGALSLFRIES